jgi:hypothetical protein
MFLGLYATLGMIISFTCGFSADFVAASLSMRG